MLKVKIVSTGNKTELWIDNRMVGRDVLSYMLVQEGGDHPKLAVIYDVGELEVESDEVEVANFFRKRKNTDPEI